MNDNTEENTNENENENEVKPMLRRSTRINAEKGVPRSHPLIQFIMTGSKNKTMGIDQVYKKIVKAVFT